eukprot:NODE_4123_length_708_cov_241.045942.p2 GENE.NODE_4123_length_708_cov_241.045942~~NODE_4123_length_708_cov_241.045942.p2  ORF type:complete len:177 (-),score=48.83 NODE_4123_length_708_cov_241.045942:161-640(-)
MMLNLQAPPPVPEGLVRLRIRRQKEVVPLEVAISPMATILDVKKRIHQLSSVPVQDQRLFVSSCRLYDDQTVEECGLARCLEAQLVPTLRHRATPGVTAVSARRGFHCLQGNAPWQPSRLAAITANDIQEFWGSKEEGDRPARKLPSAPQIALPPPYRA